MSDHPKVVPFWRIRNEFDNILKNPRNILSIDILIWNIIVLNFVLLTNKSWQGKVYVRKTKLETSKSTERKWNEMSEQNLNCSTMFCVKTLISLANKFYQKDYQVFKQVTWLDILILFIYSLIVQ